MHYVQHIIVQTGIREQSDQAKEKHIDRAKNITIGTHIHVLWIKL